MRGGIVLSSAFHVGLLGAALFSYGAPKPLAVPEIETVDVDLIPIESVSLASQGERDAPITEAPAVTPSQRPPTPEPAETPGDAATDTQSDAPPAPTPPAEAAVPVSRPKPAEPTPVPTPEVAPEPEPEQQVAMADPTPEPVAPPKPEPTIEELATPKRVIAPTARPAAPRPKPATPKTNERKKPVEVAKASPDAPETKAKPKDDQIKALLDKQAPSGGGAKRTEKQKGAGTKRGAAAKLSRNELDALRGAIEKCWNVPGGVVDAEDMRAKVSFKLDRSGALEGRPKGSVTGGSSKVAQRAFLRSTQIAVARCAPYKLPADKYETWADVTVNFSLADML